MTTPNVGTADIGTLRQAPEQHRLAFLSLLNGKIIREKRVQTGNG
jgi:hypothetical protein